MAEVDVTAAAMFIVEAVVAIELACRTNDLQALWVTQSFSACRYLLPVNGRRLFRVHSKFYEGMVEGYVRSWILLGRD